MSKMNEIFPDPAPEFTFEEVMVLRAYISRMTVAEMKSDEDAATMHSVYQKLKTITNSRSQIG